jgi:hypothetical protein
VAPFVRLADDPASFEAGAVKPGGGEVSAGIAAVAEVGPRRKAIHRVPPPGTQALQNARSSRVPMGRWRSGIALHPRSCSGGELIGEVEVAVGGSGEEGRPLATVEAKLDLASDDQLVGADLGDGGDLLWGETVAGIDRNAAQAGWGMAIVPAAGCLLCRMTAASGRPRC